MSKEECKYSDTITIYDDLLKTFDKPVPVPKQRGGGRGDLLKRISIFLNAKMPKVCRKKNKVIPEHATKTINPLFTQHLTRDLGLTVDENVLLSENVPLTILKKLSDKEKEAEDRLAEVLHVIAPILQDMKTPLTSLMQTSSQIRDTILANALEPSGTDDKTKKELFEKKINEIQKQITILNTTLPEYSYLFNHYKVTIKFAEGEFGNGLLHIEGSRLSTPYVFAKNLHSLYPLLTANKLLQLNTFISKGVMEEKDIDFYIYKQHESDDFSEKTSTKTPQNDIVMYNIINSIISKGYDYKLAKLRTTMGIKPPPTSSGGSISPQKTDERILYNGLTRIVYKTSRKNSAKYIMLNSKLVRMSDLKK